MRKRKVDITNTTGLHARPASNLSRLCKTFSSDIKIKNDKTIVNPKDIFSLLKGELKSGLTIEIEASGEDEDEAVDRICEFIETLKD